MLWQPSLDMVTWNWQSGKRTGLNVQAHLNLPILACLLTSHWPKQITLLNPARRLGRVTAHVEGGLCSCVTVGETTGKGKEMGPSLQSTTHPSSHPHSCMCGFSCIELAAFSSFCNFAHVWVLPDTFAFTSLPFCYSRAHSLWIPEPLLIVLLINNKLILSPSTGNYEQVTFVNL